MTASHDGAPASGGTPLSHYLEDLRQAFCADPLVVVTPIYNDWSSFAMLVRRIDEVCARTGTRVEIIAVDDGSTASADLPLSGFSAVARIDVVRLATNLGHQRAIAVGLAVARERAHQYVLAMDCDGEDPPEHIPAMLDAARANPDRIVCAQRRKRGEGPLFRTCYAAYKAAFRLMTGVHVDFGNFCLVPERHLERIVHSPALWNHFAAALLRLRLPLVRLPTDRGPRYAGRSQMGFVSLVLHGLSAIAAFEDICLVRLLVALGTALAALAAVLAGVVGLRLFTDLAVPGWATTAFGTVAIIMLQAVLLAAVSTSAHLNRRSSPQTIPAHEAPRYVQRIDRLFLDASRQRAEEPQAEARIEAAS